jgi:hypothetical protein
MFPGASIVVFLCFRISGNAAASVAHQSKCDDHSGCGLMLEIMACYWMNALQTGRCFQFVHYVSDRLASLPFRTPSRRLRNQK